MFCIRWFAYLSFGLTDKHLRRNNDGGKYKFYDPCRQSKILLCPGVKNEPISLLSLSFFLLQNGLNVN